MGGHGWKWAEASVSTSCINKLHSLSIPAQVHLKPFGVDTTSSSLCFATSISVKMSSTSSPATSWILQQQSGNHQQRRNSGVPVIEPLNLWPTSSNWSNYNISEKYPSRSSPLTPTTPTCSPLIFSPTSSAAAAAAFAAGIVSASQHHPPPDSPHSVVDGYMDFPTTVAPLLMDYCPTNNNNNNRKRPQPEGMPGIISQNKRSKSFTIDAILGLEDFPSSSYRSSTIEGMLTIYF